MEGNYVSNALSLGNRLISDGIMDNIPLEISLYIFTLACTDNGFTGRSLSHVSRYVREASQTVKLQSICLHGHDQILAFAELIEHTPSIARNVRQLFICNETKKSSDTPPSPPKPSKSPSNGKSEDSVRKRRLQSERAQKAYRERKTRWKRIDQATATILANVGDTIERLALSFGPAGVLKQIRGPLSLPNLVDLTITDDSLSWLTPSHRLHRLHIIYKRFTDILDPTSMSVVPALKKLRISGMRPLQGSLRIPVKFPDTLQEILISPPISPAVFGFFGSPQLIDDDEFLRLLQSDDQRNVVLEEGETGMVFDVETEERLWLEDLAYYPSQVSTC